MNVTVPETRQDELAPAIDDVGTVRYRDGISRPERSNVSLSEDDHGVVQGCGVRRRIDGGPDESEIGRGGAHSGNK